MAKNRCLEEGMISSITQLRKKPPPVATLPWKSSNPFRNKQAGRKAISCATNVVLDTVASD